MNFCRKKADNKTIATPEGLDKLKNIMFEQDGKIMVVALVLAVILAGIGMAMFFIDNRLRRIEKKIKEKEEEL